jgi:hypothetical protein
MKCRDVLIEVNRKEVQAPDPRLDGRIILAQYIVKVIGSLGRNGSYLFVTSSISGDKENRYSSDLHGKILDTQTERGPIHAAWQAYIEIYSPSCRHPRPAHDRDIASTC